MAGIYRQKSLLFTLITIIVSALLCLVPLGYLSIGDYILSFNPSFSNGSIAFFIILLSKELAGRELIKEKDLLWFSLWNISVTIIVYLSSLGFIGPDIYGTGYSFSPVFIITALLTIALIILNNPLSVIFIAYIITFIFRLLPSDNFFDHITDGVIFFASVAIIIRWIIRYKYGKPITAYTSQEKNAYETV